MSQTLRLMLLVLIIWPRLTSADQIDVEYQRDNQMLTIKHCFDAAPDYVEANDRRLQPMSRNILWQKRPAEVHRGYIELPDGQAGCLSYQVDLKQYPSNDSLRRQHPQAHLLKMDAFMWQADDHLKRPATTVVWQHDERTRVSAPWQLIERSSTRTQFVTQPTPQYADGFVAVGEIETETLVHGHAQLRVALMAGRYEHRKADMMTWLNTMATAVSQIGGGFPVEDVQVLVVMTDSSGGPVPWGQVNRAGGPGVLLVVNGNQSLAQIMADWTAAHEFSHLLTPYTPYDRWLSEGFASYHQNITRLRSGLLDEQTAWSKLIAGFERGQRTAQKHTAPVLKHANRRHNMQMYWGGAVIALKAEVALQQVSSGQKNLSDVLAGLQDCCLGLGKTWTARKLFHELDRISETQVFSELYEQEVKLSAYPDYRSTLQALGINKQPNGALSFDDQAPLAAVRKAIAQNNQSRPPQTRRQQPG